jgi:hypothetical protein
MWFQSSKFLLLLALGAIGGVTVAQRPQLMNPLRRSADQVSRWVQPGPVSDLANARDRLENSKVAFEESRQKIAEQLAAVDKKAESREQERLQVEMLLARFKEEYVAGQSAGFPRTIFNRSYTADQLRQQVQKLLERRAELQPTANGAVDRLKEALAQVDVRLATTRQHLENMPVYEALISAGHVVGQTDEALAGLDRCLEQNQAYLTTNPVRGTDELVRSLRDGDRPTANVDEFLKDLPVTTAPSAEVSATTPTVSELTAELKRFFEEHRNAAQ